MNTAGSGASCETQCAEFETLAIADPAKAVALYEELWIALLARSDVSSAVRVTRAAIQSFAHLGDTSRAIHIAARARRTALRERSRASTVEAARVLVAAMHPRAKRGDLQAALRGGLRATRELAALGEDALVARAELNLANIAKALGQPTRAIELLERVLARGAAIEAIRGAALNALGEAHVQSGHFARAVEAFDATAMFYDAQGGALHSALARGNVAHTLAKAGDIEAALRAFRDARERFALLGAHAEACRLMIEEAELLEDAGLIDDAADLVHEAHDSARRHQLRAELARSALVVGRIELRRGRALAAEPMLDEAMTLASSMSDRIALAQTFVAKSACLSLLNDADGAKAAAEKAYQLADTPFEKVVALIALVDSDSSAASALAWADEAVNLAHSLGLPALEGEVMCARSNAAFCAQRFDEALFAARNAVTLLDDAQNKLVVKRLRRSFLAQRTRTYTTLAARMLSTGGSTTEALAVVEHARHRAIVEALLDTPRESHDAQPTHVVHPEALQEDALRGDAPQEDALHVHESRPDVLEKLSQARRRSDRHLLDTRVAEARNSADSGNVSFRFRQPHCASLVFFEHSDVADAPDARDALDVFVVPPTGHPTVLPIAGKNARIRRSQLDECIQEFRFHVARYLAGSTTIRSTRLARASFDTLRELLFSPVRAWLETQSRETDASCVIVPCASLAGLPLATLAPDGVLASVAPSLGIASLLDENDGATRPRDVGFRRNVVISVSDEFTPGLAREGSRVASLLAGDTQHLDGVQATRAAFSHALAAADHAHIACHGIFPSTAPNLAGLFLTDGWFGAHHAHALPRAPRDIVLSGCSTGLSTDGAGEQWFGLVRGFAARGAARMLASLWPVVDRDAEAFMEALYAPSAGDSTQARTTRAITIARTQLAEGVHPAAAAAWTVIGGARAYARQHDPR